MDKGIGDDNNKSKSDEDNQNDKIIKKEVIKEESKTEYIDEWSNKENKLNIDKKFTKKIRKRPNQADSHNVEDYKSLEITDAGSLTKDEKLKSNLKNKRSVGKVCN